MSAEPTSIIASVVIVATSLKTQAGSESRVKVLSTSDG